MTATCDTRIEVLYRTMYPVVLRFACGRVGAADAEDVAAEVLRVASEKLAADDGIELAPAWFLTAARNRIIDRWRRERRWQERLPFLRVEAAVRADASAGGDTGDERVEAALARLSPDHRRVLVLRYVDGYSASDVARAIGRTARAVDSLLARAKHAFAAEYERVCAG
jgi:RNA polymerase sigma-70 factor (ECF subfamily)